MIQADTAGETTELEALKAAVAGLSASEEESLAVEPELRETRRARAEQFSRLDADEAKARFSGEPGKAHRILAGSGLRDLERDAQEEALAERLRPQLKAEGAVAPGSLLAAMLLFQSF